MGDRLVIALSKGRLYQQVLPLLRIAGVTLLDDHETSRKLVIDTCMEGVKVVIVRAADVPTYVQYGGADLGVVGKDVLMEHGGEGLYEPLDLEISRCRLVVAGTDATSGYGDEGPRARLRVATKFVSCARRYYAQRGQQVEIIKLYGSMELAPLVGMADRIVDLVDSGATLRANGLHVQALIAEISARLVVNKAAMKMKHRTVRQLIDKLRLAVIGNRQPH